MKTILVALVATLISSFTFFQNDDAIINAFKKADATEVSKYFDDAVDLKFLDKDENKNVGKRQAAIVLKNFFSEYQINGFTPTSKREMGGTKYIVGKLSGKGQQYNLTLMLRAKDGGFAILSIRIN